MKSLIGFFFKLWLELDAVNGMYQPPQATQETEVESEIIQAHKFKTSLVNIGTLFIQTRTNRNY